MYVSASTKSNKGADSKAQAKVLSKGGKNKAESKSLNSPGKVIDEINHLQKTVGNRAVQRMIKSGKIQLKKNRGNRGKPGNAYGREVGELVQRVEQRLMEESQAEQELGEVENGFFNNQPVLSSEFPSPYRQAAIRGIPAKKRNTPSDWGQRTPPVQFTRKGAAVGGLVGALAGGGIGAAIGTAVMPGVGTLIGGGIGALLGGIGGAMAGHALTKPTITHATTLAAPDGTANTRTTIAVGEEVTFTGSKAGTWTAGAGTPNTLANSAVYVWRAPNRAANVNIKLAADGDETTVAMNVIEPNNITADKNSEIAYMPGQQGAGMKLTFIYHPLNVSFGNIENKEVSHAATGITGYYRRHGMPHWHNTGDTFYAVGADNRDSAEDTAAQSNYPSPWTDGFFEWIVPNKFKVNTEGGDGKQFTTVTQDFTIEGPSGKTTIRKAGQQVERTP